MEKCSVITNNIGGKPNTDETGILPYLPVYKGPPEGIAQTPELAKEYPFNYF
jgi:hypothetical protein